MADEPYVVVTTSREAGRGVFAGYLIETDGDKVTLRDARNCIYWSKDVLGFVGLAVTGPIGDSRVGPAAPKMELAGLTSITHCTEIAKKLWEDGPWRT